MDYDWNTVTTGFTELDSLLEKGGIPTGHAVLIEKDAGTKAGILSLYFLYKNFKEGKKAAYFITDKDPRFMLRRMEKDFNFLIGEERRGDFVFIDGFVGGHLRDETKPETSITSFIIHDLRDVHEVHGVFREVMIGWGSVKFEIPDLSQKSWDTQAVWVYDSISTLIYYGGREALTLVAHQMAAQKKHFYTGYFVVENNSLPAETMRMLELWADGVICLGTENRDGKQTLNLQIKKMRWVDYCREKIPCELSPKGLKLLRDVSNWSKKPSDKAKF